jgi:hypothetical protein
MHSILFEKETNEILTEFFILSNHQLTHLLVKSLTHLSTESVKHITSGTPSILFVYCDIC